LIPEGRQLGGFTVQVRDAIRQIRGEGTVDCGLKALGGAEQQVGVC